MFFHTYAPWSHYLRGKEPGQSCILFMISFLTAVCVEGPPLFWLFNDFLKKKKRIFKIGIFRFQKREKLGKLQVL